MARYWVIVAQLNSWYMKKEETNNLDSIWIDVVKAIDNIKNNHSEKAIQATQEAGKIAIKQTIKNFIPRIFDL